MNSAPTLPRQTTVFFGGSNGTKTIISSIGDKTNPEHGNHTLRVVTRNPSNFLKTPSEKTQTSNSNSKQDLIEWRCQEQKHFSNVFPASFIPSTWTTHVGKPDGVFGYSEADLEAAISGIGAANGDDGGVADVIVLACPVYAHLNILRHIARALYKLDAENKLLSKNAPPLLIGTLYAAGGFDWMCRLAFSIEKPASFVKWNRDLGLFGLRSFPYLCKSLKKGEVSLFGRFPQLSCVVSPSTELMRDEVTRRVMFRVLQGHINDIKMDFVGLDERPVEVASTQNIYSNVRGAAAASVVASQIGSVRGVEEKGKSVSGSGPRGELAPAAVGSFALQGEENNKEYLQGPPKGLEVTLAYKHMRSMLDLADPLSALGFLSCTLNATNQILHPCIIYSLFNTSSGAISWPEKDHATPFPRFYADGANKEAGKNITSIAVAEMYPLISILDAILAPDNMTPIGNQHGGEPMGRYGLTKVGNHPNDIAERSGLMDKVLYGIESGKKSETVNFRSICNWAMHKGLSNNSRLGYVLAPAIRDKENTDIIRPIVTSRFFVDDVPHGLCVALGLGEMLGFDLEKDMAVTLRVVRRLQGWMGKEYVLPENSSMRGKGIVGGAKDLNETSAPQAFGVWTVEDLRRFLNTDLFGEDNGKIVDLNVRGSALIQDNIANSKL